MPTLVCSQITESPPGRRLRRFLKRTVVLLPCLYCLTIAILIFFEDRLVFRDRAAPPSATNSQHDHGIEPVVFTSSDGTTIGGRWCPRPGARRVLLLCHDRGARLGMFMSVHKIQRWQEELDASLLLFDYPGYGQSGGVATETGCGAAAEAAHDWLCRERAIAPDQIVIVGCSLGTGVAVELATRRPHAAVILLAPYTSLPEVAESICPLLPARPLMRNRFDSLSKISRCPAPICIVHSTDDPLIPYAHGQRLFAAAPGPKQLITLHGIRHNCQSAPEFFPEVREFLKDHHIADAVE